MSNSGDKMSQIRLWDGVREQLDEIVARSVTPSNRTVVANMAITRGLKVLEKEIALKPVNKTKTTN